MPIGLPKLNTTIADSIRRRTCVPQSALRPLAFKCGPISDPFAKLKPEAGLTLRSPLAGLKLELCRIKANSLEL